MKQDNILITIPHSSFHGGVGNIYRILNLDESDEVEYFYNTEANRSANPKFFLLMIFRFIKHIRRKKIVHLNPSLDYKAVIRDGVLLLIAKLFHKHVIVFFHGWDDQFEEKIKNNYFYINLFSSAFNKADAFILLGQVFYEKLCRMGINCKTIHYIPTIADDYYINPSQVKFELLKPKSVNLLFIAGFAPSKGMDIVLNSMKYLQNNKDGWQFELFMAGDGPELERWKRFVEEKSLSNVNFLGYVNGLEKHNLFMNSDILFFPSLSEGLPCVIMEAMLYGLAIVTRPVGGIPYWVKHDENGWLSDSVNPEVFAKGIISLVNQHDHLTKIRKRNHVIAANNFTPQKVKRQLKIVYEKISDKNA